MVPLILSDANRSSWGVIDMFRYYLKSELNYVPLPGSTLHSLVFIFTCLHAPKLHT